MGRGGVAKTSEDYPGQCLDESGEPHKVGTSWQPKESCMSLTCGTGPNNTLQVNGESCGLARYILGPEHAHCHMESQDDLPYPACCEKKMKCPSDKETNKGPKPLDLGLTNGPLESGNRRRNSKSGMRRRNSKSAMGRRNSKSAMGRRNSKSAMRRRIFNDFSMIGE